MSRRLIAILRGVAPERAVDVDAVDIGDEGVDRFRQENAQVLQG